MKDQGSLVSIKNSRLNYWNINNNLGVILSNINSNHIEQSYYCIFDLKIVGPVFESELNDFKFDS